MLSGGRPIPRPEGSDQPPARPLLDAGKALRLRFGPYYRGEGADCDSGISTRRARRAAGVAESSAKKRNKRPTMSATAAKVPTPSAIHIPRLLRA